MHKSCLLIGFLSCYPLFGITVTMVPSVASPQPVGTSVVWTPTASDPHPGAIDFRFSVGPGGQAYQLLQDFDVTNTFTWTPYVREGSFNVSVTARNTSTGQTASSVVPFTITALTSAVGGSPVISATANPLVALYSAPGCPTGSNVRVKFVKGATVQRTTGVPCSPTATSNFYVAGMLPSSTYQMNYEIVKNGVFTSGPVLPFTTGSIPANLTFPSISVPQSGSTDTQQSVMLVNALPEQGHQTYFPFATDLSGHVIWYYSNIPASQAYNLRPTTGGSIMMLVATPTNPSLTQQLFREIDLAGNTIRSTSTQRMSQQLVAEGKYPIVSVNHDVIRLPNGHTLLIASQEKMYPAGTQGATAPVDILGDCIIDLDTNLQIAWSWSAYDFLDINRAAVLGEVCTVGVFGCPPLHLATTASDWIHGNSLFYRTDGNLLFSSRHQDFIYKIDYANGTGAGDVMWTMGLGGDFTMSGTSDPYPWFSHQHNAEFTPGGSTLMTVYDNGNTRVTANPGENSRGQALNVDETSLTVSLALNQDLGVFSTAVGSAQFLDNGDYFFDSGWIISGPNLPTTAYSQEITPTGAVEYQFDDSTRTYRVYRMSTLYSEP
jgi:arylsulfate sulfotransferase